VVASRAAYNLNSKQSTIGDLLEIAISLIEIVKDTITKIAYKMKTTTAPVKNLEILRICAAVETISGAMVSRFNL
jgi:hypothetical protein